MLVTIFVAFKILKEFNHRKEIGFEYTSHDLHWNKKLIIKFPIYALISGIAAGMLGIGGGLILGPLLLGIGLHPIVSSATSNFLVLFISSSTALQFMLSGMMNYNYGLACVVMTSVGSLMGTLIIQRLVKKSGRSSLIIFILAGVLLIATIVIPLHTVFKIIEMGNKGQNIWGFEPACRLM